MLQKEATLSGGGDDGGEGPAPAVHSKEHGKHLSIEAKVSSR
jgi:hypothetical protein